MIKTLLMAFGIALACASSLQAAEERLSVGADGPILAQDGGEISLSGLFLPDLPADLAAERIAFLTRMIDGKAMDVRLGALPQDRYGRTLAHLYDPAGQWVQGLLLEQGYAIVQPLADRREHTKAMLEIEAKARAEKRGLWGDRHFAVLMADDAALSRKTDAFRIVSGQIADIKRVKGKLYINFGEDWRHDFTLMIDSKTMKLFRDDRIDLESLKGRNIRIRGWLRFWNGPFLQITCPEQIEVL